MELFKAGTRLFDEIVLENVETIQKYRKKYNNY